MTAEPQARDEAARLLEDLVSIPSLSGEEAEASRFLVSRMEALGFERAFVDAAGNAVGELGAVEAARRVVLLGHIDTVPGAIEVRHEEVEGDELLFGRGSVDAKGPLAVFTVAAARLGKAWARERGMLLVVVGAVEEEAATSRGARFIRDRFDGSREAVPDACLIGEPSHWDRITLGYKGRLLVELGGWRPMAHTAGPEQGVAVLAVELWRHLEEQAAAWNREREKTFEQLQPSLRAISTECGDPFCERVEATFGLRLPPGFEAEELKAKVRAWAAESVGGVETELTGESERYRYAGESSTLELAFHSHEPAWRESHRSPLVASFLGAIRAVGKECVAPVQPRFVVKTGTSDMNVVAPAWRCPILAYGPGDSRLDHTPNEHVSLEEVWRAVQVVEAGLRRFERGTR